jgi:hypothetical protein
MPRYANPEISEPESPLRRLMYAVPGLRWLYHEARRQRNFRDPEVAAFVGTYPPGHYYSAIPRLSDALRAVEAVAGVRTVPGVDLRTEAQLALLADLAAFAATIPFGEAGEATGCRYAYGNTWFEHCDAVVLHALLRHLRPARLLEVGSGFSSAVTLDTNDRFLAGSLAITFVEPNPYRLDALLRDSDRTRHTVIRRPVWEAPLEALDALRPGDIFFIDTSHVLKPGSDVHYLFFEMLPRLAPGVIIHLHDIFWPFEYPEDWLRMGRAYNEAYLARALLTQSRGYEILFFNHYLQCCHPEAVTAALPVAMRSRGSSLWLRKTA